MDVEALNDLPTEGALPGTVLTTEDGAPHNVDETSGGPSTSTLNEQTDIIRPSILTLGSDVRSTSERFGSMTSGPENAAHMCLGEHVRMYLKHQWKVILYIRMYVCTRLAFKRQMLSTDPRNRPIMKDIDLFNFSCLDLCRQHSHNCLFLVEEVLMKPVKDKCHLVPISVTFSYYPLVALQSAVLFS